MWGQFAKQHNYMKIATGLFGVVKKTLDKTNLKVYLEENTHKIAKEFS